MGIKESSYDIIIQDAMTAEILVKIPLMNLSYTTIHDIIADLVGADMYEKHGFYIKYGIRS